MTAPVVNLHVGDLPADVSFGNSVAIDTETMGLNPHRDRLCVVQLSAGDGTAHIVQIIKNGPEPVRLKALLSDDTVLKIFHFARFDLAALYNGLGVMTAPVYCTKIASKLSRTYTDRHGLKELAHEILGLELSKHQQSSDWGAADLTQQQLAYAAHDVLHLHAIKHKLDAMLAREGRTAYAEAAFRFLPIRARLDLAGFADDDIFAH
jgi:ribonuclease D